MNALFLCPASFSALSSFTASGSEGSFYPLGMRSKDFLRHYASQFQTVEIDSTFYGTPSPSTVTSWYEKTPGDFIFAANGAVKEGPYADAILEFIHDGTLTEPESSRHKTAIWFLLESKKAFFSACFHAGINAIKLRSHLKRCIVQEVLRIH